MFITTQRTSHEYHDRELMSTFVTVYDNFHDFFLPILQQEQKIHFNVHMSEVEH